MNEKYKQDFLRAGQIAKEVRFYGKSLIQPGISYNEVIRKIYEKIHQSGALPAFPPQIALNQVAAHYLPDPNEDIIFSDQVVKLDIGISYEGAIGDCAVSIDLSGKNQTLIDAAEAALLAAEQAIEVGITFGEIGRTIEETIHSFGYKPVKNLCGHGLGHYQIHTSPSVPNYNDHSKAIVKKGMTFAIEPFATTGSGFILESGHATIFSLVRMKPVNSPEARTLLAKIRAFNGLPFAIHDLLKDGAAYEGVRTELGRLIQAGIVAGYPPLVEREVGLVAQAENSILVDKNGKVTISTR